MKLKSKSSEDAKAVGISNYAEFFYDDKLVIRRKMVEAIRKQRKLLGYSRARLDRVCFFGFTLPRTKRKLPTCAEFEANPELMDSFVFSLASAPLRLSIDRVLEIRQRVKLRMTEAHRKNLIREMKKNGWGVKAGAGGGNVGRIPFSNQIALYVLFRILAELNYTSKPVE